MQDPSYGVPSQLLPHVHLISANKYPLFHQLNLDQAYHFLFEATKVVKQIAPMQWQYLAGPQDGMIFLTWIGGRMQNSFASDGYIWADQEQRYTQDFGGYTLEIAVHHSGYRPGIDQMSSHARRRYRFVSKNPSVTALPPDPSLWIVHYSQADPQSCVPSSQVLVSQQMRAQLSERHWIEGQGRLEQQAFMLHDREKWPHLSLPGRTGLPGPIYTPGMQSQNPMAHVGNPRFSGQFYQQAQAAQQAQVGPSPAKRARQHAPSQMPASAAALMATDTSIEDEENVLYGDILDHLTQRDISLTRYIQHHEWMEEVFSSPYATGTIIPADLGFGLMGELASLTDGLMDIASPDQEKPLAKNAPEPSYKKITPDQLSEFEKRVKAHMENSQAEIDRMKEDHAKKMAQLKKSKTLLQAEKRLRNAVWDPADTGSEMWRLDRAAVTNPETAPARPKEAADDVVKEVQNALGGTIKPQKEATLVEKGGLKEKKAAPPPPPVIPDMSNESSSNGVQMQVENSFDQPIQSRDQQSTTGSEQKAQPAVSAPPQDQQPPSEQSTQAHQSQVQQPSQPPPQPQIQTAQSQPQHTSSLNQASSLNQSSLENAPQNDPVSNNDATMDVSLMNDIDMDMDVDGSPLNFDTTGIDPSPKSSNTGEATPSMNTWSNDQQQPPQASAQHQQQQSTQNNIPNNASNSKPADQPSGGATINAGELFDVPGAAGDANFADFDASDGLIDFNGGEGDMSFDMDNSAFGDAFHGTEAHGDGDGS